MEVRDVCPIDEQEDYYDEDENLFDRNGLFSTSIMRQVRAQGKASMMTKGEEAL